MGDTAQQAKHAATYRFCTKSSQYAAVEPLLKADERWTAVNGTGYRLLLADRWDVPYARLGVDEGLPGCKPLVNHMRGTKHITVKGLMVRTLRAYCEARALEGQQVDLQSMIPETFLCVPGGGLADERNALTQAAEAAASLWICKPTAGAHGKGIQVVQGYMEALTVVDGALKAEAPSDDAAAALPRRTALRPKAQPAWLVQRYVAAPFLVGGRKFDIRALVVITPRYHVLWYTKWILRMCSEEYTADDLHNQVKHISNHCIQTSSAAYGSYGPLRAEHRSKFEDGNELFTDDFLRYLTDMEGSKQAAATLAHCVDQMKRIALHTTEAVREGAGGEDYESFQVLGYDFMIDENRKVWLLEVNGSPACADRMVHDFAVDLKEAVLDPHVLGIGGAGGGPVENGATLRPANRFERIHMERA